MDLDQLQALLYRLITAPRDASPPQGEADSVITGDRRLDAAARVRIYADSYFYRLAGVLKDDYPALFELLGEERFTALVTDYLAAYPPTQPSVFDAGRHLATFMRDTALDHPPWIADLAALERALLEAFHGPDAPALTATGIAAIAPEQWPALMLRMHPAATLVRCRTRAGQTLRAFENHRADSAQAASGPLPQPQPVPTPYLVWRQDQTAYFRELDSAEAAALEAARTPASFADICSAAAGSLADANASAGAIAEINRMLAQWLEDGVLMLPRPVL